VLDLSAASSPNLSLPRHRISALSPNDAQAPLSARARAKAATLAKKGKAVTLELASVNIVLAPSSGVNPAVVTPATVTAAAAAGASPLGLTKASTRGNGEKLTRTPSRISAASQSVVASLSGFFNSARRGKSAARASPSPDASVARRLDAAATLPNERPVAPLTDGQLPAADAQATDGQLPAADDAPVAGAALQAADEQLPAADPASPSGAASTPAAEDEQLSISVISPVRRLSPRNLMGEYGQGGELSIYKKEGDKLGLRFYPNLVDDKYLEVDAVARGSLAETHGIKAGDLIEEINSINLLAAKLTPVKCAAKLRSSLGEITLLMAPRNCSVVRTNSRGALPSAKGDGKATEEVLRIRGGNLKGLTLERLAQLRIQGQLSEAEVGALKGSLLQSLYLTQQTESMLTDAEVLLGTSVHLC